MSQAAALEPLIPALRRYAFALTRDHHAADGLVQDTLERALGRWMLRGAEEDLRARLFSILHNRFIDLQRVRSRRPLHGTLDEEVEAATTSPTQAVGCWAVTCGRSSARCRRSTRPCCCSWASRAWPMRAWHRCWTFPWGR